MKIKLIAQIKNKNGMGVLILLVIVAAIGVFYALANNTHLASLVNRKQKESFQLTDMMLSQNQEILKFVKTLYDSGVLVNHESAETGFHTVKLDPVYVMPTNANWQFVNSTTTETAKLNIVFNKNYTLTSSDLASIYLASKSPTPAPTYGTACPTCYQTTVVFKSINLASGVLYVDIESQTPDPNNNATTMNRKSQGKFMLAGGTTSGSTAGSSTAGSSTAGSSTAGSSSTGGSTTGGSTTGGSTTGGSTTGGSTTGGAAAGSSTSGSGTGCANIDCNTVCGGNVQALCNTIVTSNSSTPIVISDFAGFQANFIDSVPDGKFFQLGSSMSGTGTNNLGPINNVIFQGCNYSFTKVSNDSTGLNDVGIFRAINDSIIDSITFVPAGTVVKGETNVGHLAGQVTRSCLSNLSFPAFEIQGAANVGGIVGKATDSYLYKFVIEPGTVYKQIGSATHENFGGLVGEMNGGKIYRPPATGPWLSGIITAHNVGGVVGYAHDGPTKPFDAELGIVYIDSNVGGVWTDGMNAGGFAGRINTTGTIKRICINTFGSGGGGVGIFSIAPVVVSDTVGGFVGLFEAGTIENSCTVVPQVLGGSYVGGFVGNWVGGTISYSYAAPGFVGTGINSPPCPPNPPWANGFSGSGGSAANSYWSNWVAANDCSNSAVNDFVANPRTTAQMGSAATFVSWDFTTIWVTPSPPAIPYPQIQIPP